MEPVEEEIPRLRRVERVLRERERTGPCGGPGVDQRDLDEVVLAVRAGQVAARLVVDDRHPRVLVEVACKVPKPLVRDVDDVAVDLQARDRPLTELERGEDVRSSADADDADRCTG